MNFLNKIAFDEMQHRATQRKISLPFQKAYF